MPISSTRFAIRQARNSSFTMPPTIRSTLQSTHIMIASGLLRTYVVLLTMDIAKFARAPAVRLLALYKLRKATMDCLRRMSRPPNYLRTWPSGTLTARTHLHLSNVPAAQSSCVRTAAASAQRALTVSAK